MAEKNGKAKYFNLMEALKKDIANGIIRPGDKIPSENVLSQQFGVSRHTVRKALSILEEEGLIAAQHGRGTFCIKRTRTGGSRNIAVITTYINDYIFPRLIQGIDEVMTEQGYSIILKNTYNSRKNEEKALEDIMTKDVEGLIIEPSKSEIFCRHIHQYEELDLKDIPYIFIQGTYPQLSHKPSIIMDDVQGGYLITKYLLELGHKNVAGIFKIDDVQGNNRYKGYVKALNEFGISYNPERVVLYHTEDRRTKPCLMVKHFIETGVSMDAIVCYNDQVAMEVIQALSEKGLKVPEDISVTGYDNSLIAENGPVPLTTISHPKEQLGRMAAQLLLEKMNGVPEEKSTVPRIIVPELVVRDSCRKRD